MLTGGTGDQLCGLLTTGGEVGWDQDTSLLNLQLPIPRSDQLCRRRGRESSYPGTSPAPSIQTVPACPSTPNPLQNCTTRLQPMLRAKPDSGQPHSPFKAMFSLQALIGNPSNKITELFDWRSPLRSLNPTINPARTTPALTHAPRATSAQLLNPFGDRDSTTVLAVCSNT